MSVLVAGCDEDGPQLYQVRGPSSTRPLSIYSTTTQSPDCYAFPSRCVRLIPRAHTLAGARRPLARTTAMPRRFWRRLVRDNTQTDISFACSLIAMSNLCAALQCRHGAGGCCSHVTADTARRIRGRGACVWFFFWVCGFIRYIGISAQHPLTRIVLCWLRAADDGKEH